MNIDELIMESFRKVVERRAKELVAEKAKELQKEFDALAILSIQEILDLVIERFDFMGMSETEIVFKLRTR